MNQETITVVSGLPRSGTSMMMKMLEAGGMELLVDGIREADEDNPKGYYELEKVKELDKEGRDTSWLADARGKVVKIISQLLKDLPPDYNYKVVFIRRHMPEILASQKKMLERRGEPTDRISDEELSRLFEKHLLQLEGWLQKQPNFDVLYVHYNEILKSPQKYIDQVNAFLGSNLNTQGMASVIDKSLHRQKA